MSLHTTIIAEAGVNHNGDVDIAMQLVDVAASSGADYVKFQTFKAENIVTRIAGKASYQKSGASDEESQYAMLKKLELSEEDHMRLRDYCREKTIGFLSTAFDLESLNFLKNLGLNLFKVSSGDITNLPYLECLGAFSKEVILSTGISTMDEIGEALEILNSSGTPNNQITILHCTSEYPAPMEEVNLKAMLFIRDRFNVSVGYSDHTEGIEIPIAAAALGASVIEKHFTLDRSLPGPDHLASIEPRELSQMVQSIRNIELALGDGEKVVSRSEMKNRDVVRKSVVAKRDIRLGEIFSIENLDSKRPGTGISPMKLPEILGKPSPRDFTKDELIEL